jgi:putative flippase GtrA
VWSSGAPPWSGAECREGRQGPEGGLRVTLAPPLGATEGTTSLVTDRTATSTALPADGTHFWAVGDHVPRLTPLHPTSECEAPPNEETRGLRSALIRRFVRYGSVSAISTVISLVTLGILVGALGAPAVLSNVIATAVATGPSFELNRRWVWAHTGQRSIRRQAVPYFLLSFLGLIVSTLAVHLAADATAHSTRLVHTAAVEIATILSYGVLWLVQFFLCDRLLFRVQPSGSVVLGVAPS